MNPFTDQSWSEKSPVNPAPNFYIPTNQPVSTNSAQYSATTSDSFKNVNINQTNVQSNDQKPIHSLPIRILNQLFSNYEMMICKLFYFLFYSAFGSLFPLIGIYFKQQGMTASQTGILIGCRYLVEIFSSPFWSNLAERFNKGKTILIGSLMSWIILTSALAFIRPPAAACVSFNGSAYVLYEPYLEDMENVAVRNKRWIIDDEHISYFKSGVHYLPFSKQMLKKKLEKEERDKQLPSQLQMFDQQMRLPPNHVIGKSPLTIEYTVNYDDELHSDYVSPPFSHIVYKKSETNEVWILLLLLMLIGEFFASPTICLVDTVTMKKLSNNLNNYSKQRIFGSLGWGIAMLFIGLALDNSTEFENHPCGPHIQERNYNVCFKTFACLMTLASIVATQFNFDSTEIDQNVESNELNTRNQVNSNPLNPKTSAQPSQFSTAGEQSENLHHSTILNGKKRKFELLDQFKSGVFAQNFNRRLEWFSLFKNITNIKLIAIISLAWFMGTGIGLVFSFLFWHLQDLNGSPFLFGIASVVNHISEIAAYFHSLHFIKKYGHTRILVLALFCNFLRFLYISYIDNPWYVLPFELVQGVTHATIWAVFCSYLNHTIPECSKSSTQAILQIVHSGFGKGLGSIIGGFLISAYGTRVTFAIYAFSSLVAICIFVFIMNVYKRQLAPTVNLGNLGEQTSGRDRKKWLDDDLKNQNLTVNENEYVTGGLSPHGVPTAPINRTPSKSSSAASTKTRIEPKLSYNEEDAKLDEYITKNHRDWRITMNKHYN